MKLLTIIIFLITNSVCIAQIQDNILLAKINNGNTEEKLEAYLALTESLTMRDFDRAISMSNSGKTIALQSKDFDAVANFSRIIGEAYYFKGLYDSAAIYYFQALQDVKKSGSKLTSGKIFNNLGKFYRKTKDYDRALQNYAEALQIYKDIGNEVELATILNESGVVFEYMGNYEEALTRYYKSLETREKLNDQLGKSYSLNFIGNVYAQQKKYDKALDNLNEAISIKNKIKDTFSLAYCYSDLALAYKLKNELVKAEYYYKESNRIANILKLKALISSTYHELSSVAELKLNFKEALSYYQDYSEIKDSIFDEKKINQIEELNAKYNTEKKEAQLALQKAQIKNRNYMLGASIILMGILIFLAFNEIRIRKAKNLVVLQNAVLTEQKNAVKAVIVAEEKERGRIAAELHDGVGQMVTAAKMNLSAIEMKLPDQNLELKQGFSKALKLVDESCTEIRLVSHQMITHTLAKKGLGYAVREFLSHLNDDLIDMSFHEDGFGKEGDKHVETVLYRVIQECVNNVLKHSHAKKLDISLIKDEDGI
ncbi:MAG: tetratricopeptide repeat protein, partial [Ferruginibacter sp.]